MQKQTLPTKEEIDEFLENKKNKGVKMKDFWKHIRKYGKPMPDNTIKDLNLIKKVERVVKK